MKLSTGGIVAISTFGFIFLIVLISLLSGISIYNKLVSSQENVNQSWANVQNVYQRRSDLIQDI